MNDKYIITVVRVPQVPVDNNHDVVVVYDKDTKKCACSNKFASQFKSREHAIGLLKMFRY